MNIFLEGVKMMVIVYSIVISYYIQDSHILGVTLSLINVYFNDLKRKNHYNTLHLCKNLVIICIQFLLFKNIG